MTTDHLSPSYLVLIMRPDAVACQGIMSLCKTADEAREILGMAFAEAVQRIDLKDPDITLSADPGEYFLVAGGSRQDYDYSYGIVTCILWPKTITF